jgi:hypothetical protein
VGDEPYRWSTGVGMLFLEAEYGRRARWEVVKARTKEHLGKLTRTSPA